MNYAVRVENVFKTFPNGTEAARGLTLSIEPGQIFGVLGPNGAGKTTLMNMISTLLEPDRGLIEVLGLNAAQNAKEIRSRINLCSGHANFAWSLTIEENLRFYGMLYGLSGKVREDRIQSLLSAFALEKYAHNRFDEVSTGTKQRLALAKSLINEPEVLLLDEPTVGLDPDVALKVRTYIKEFHVRTNCTLVLTTHYMQEAQDLCQKVAFVRDGQVKAVGTPDELVKQLQVKDMEAVFLELAK